MFEYASRSDFARFAANLTINEQASVRKMAEDRSPNGATFLSHSTKDEQLVAGTIKLLENHGATVYIDKKDPELPPYTNKYTANGLKTRIGQSQKFLLLATINSMDSRWVPWELGLADGYKDLSRVAIIPTVENQSDTSWVNWEYLGLYDRVVWGDLKGYAEKVWMVLDQKINTAVELTKWLKR